MFPEGDQVSPSFRMIANYSFTTKFLENKKIFLSINMCLLNFAEMAKPKNVKQ